MPLSLILILGYLFDELYFKLYNIYKLFHILIYIFSKSSPLVVASLVCLSKQISPKSHTWQQIQVGRHGFYVSSYDLPRFIRKFKAYIGAEVARAKKKQQLESEEEYEGIHYL